MLVDPCRNAISGFQFLGPGKVLRLVHIHGVVFLLIEHLGIVRNGANVTQMIFADGVVLLGLERIFAVNLAAFRQEGLLGLVHFVQMRLAAAVKLDGVGN